MTKLCSKCKLELELTEFHKNKSSKDGLRSYCKSCNKSYYESYKEANEDVLKDKWKSASKKYHTYDKRRNKTLRQYGLTEETYNIMYDSQDGACAICGSKLTLCVDHCHETGNIRELLCNRCNLGLGHFQDNIELMIKATKYLEKHKG